MKKDEYKMSQQVDTTNYKEKYKRALERAVNIYGASETKDVLQTLEIVFPELKESEDERIRKEIINFLKENLELGRADKTWNSKNIEIWINWLEKQTKQNYIDANKEWYDFIRWFVKQRTDDYTLIPSDDDIHKWGDNILNHARKVIEQNLSLSDEGEK